MKVFVFQSFNVTGETFLSKANKQINFKNITLNEAGGYMCLASNAAGFKQVQVNITVLCE